MIGVKWVGLRRQGLWGRGQKGRIEKAGIKGVETWVYGLRV
jgi:hypothetical protein